MKKVKQNYKANQTGFVKQIVKQNNNSKSILSVKNKKPATKTLAFSISLVETGESRTPRPEEVIPDILQA